jgi:hypothetical protein
MLINYEREICITDSWDTVKLSYQEDKQSLKQKTAFITE